jgi:hypothetical protein
MDRKPRPKLKLSPSRPLKPLAPLSTHLKLRRTLLSSVQLPPSIFSPSKPKPHQSSHSLSQLSISSSSQDLKSYISSNLKLLHSKSTKHKPHSKSQVKPSPSFQYDANPSASKPFTAVASKTLTGMLCGKPKKSNQDAFFVHDPFAGVPGQAFLGVLDGHGLFGAQVSGFVKRTLPATLASLLSPDCNT